MWQLTATEAAAAIAAGSLSSREVVRAALDRIAATNPAVNALVEVDAENALAAADRADRARKDRRPLGVLHGLPVATKVNSDQAGHATTDGVAAFRDRIAAEDSPVIANLRKAGAVIVGRTNTPAFSHNWFTDNDLHGATVNPWDRQRTPGGSSGGAAAAVATGMCALAQGNDLGGSVRFPAFACGIAGLRPTVGRIPGHLSTVELITPITAQLMGVQGPLARTVADLRAGFEAMAADDSRDPFWVPAPLDGPPLDRPIRVALCPDPFGDATPEIKDAVAAAGAHLADAGYQVDAIDLPKIREAADLWNQLVPNVDRFGVEEPLLRLGDDRARRNYRAHAAYSPELSAEDLLHALERRVPLIQAWQLFLDRYPVVVLPVCHEPPFPVAVNQTADAAVLHRMIDSQRSLVATAALGFPSVALPTGTTRSGPVGVQVLSRRFREDVCLAAAEAIEARAGRLTPIDPV